MGRSRKYPQLHDCSVLKDLLAEYGSDGAVARKLGCDTSAVCHARHRMGVETSWYRPYPSLHDRRTLKKLMREHGTDKAIAREVGCSVGAVAWNRRRFGYIRCAGSETKYPQLYDPVALNLLSEGCGSYAELARKVGCSEFTARWACRLGGVRLPRTEKRKAELDR